MRSLIFFVAPLPPPIHGFSWVNSQVYDLVRKKCRVVHFDRNPSDKGKLATLLSFFVVLSRFVFSLLTSRPAMVYIGWSGGFSMVIDFFYVCFSRLFFVPVCLHHHSFAYLNEVRWFNKLALGLIRIKVHVVLCESMADALVEKYNVLKENIKIVSNAAFLPPAVVSDFRRGDKISIGFLSNVTEAKGIFEFFDLAKKFSSDERFHFYVAGPVAADIALNFSDRILSISNVTHVGSVYSDKKENFLRSLDVFVFPTKYVNEAEPVSISEAMRAGLPVISIARGCISGMLDDSGLVTTLNGFIDDASVFIRCMAEDHDFYVAERFKSMQRFESLRSDSLQKLEALVDHLSGHAG